MYIDMEQTNLETGDVIELSIIDRGDGGRAHNIVLAALRVRLQTN